MKPLIWVESVIERHSHSRVEYTITAKSQFKRRSNANNVEITIPVPADADSPKFKTTVGTVKYAPGKHAFVWTIKQFQGGKDLTMQAHFNLPSIQAGPPVVLRVCVCVCVCVGGGGVGPLQPPHHPRRSASHLQGGGVKHLTRTVCQLRL